jgi:5-methyltetrahydrofolate--homocysteine methyltransferase
VVGVPEPVGGTTESSGEARVDLKQIYEYTVSGNAAKVKELTQQALAEGVAPGEIVTDYLIPAMGEVGDRFERNEFYVPELLIAARAMQGALEILKPLLADSDLKATGRVVIGTVKGDLHDIGKNLVSMMLQGAGFEVVDLGVDVTPDKFVDAIKANRAQIVALSALLTTTMPAMKTTIEAVEAAGLRDQVAVLIGGAPVTQRYADEIGAEGYAPDANSAVRRAKELLKTRAA